MSDPWQRLLEGEREDIRLTLREEFGERMVTVTITIGFLVEILTISEDDLPKYREMRELGLIDRLHIAPAR